MITAQPITFLNTGLPVLLLAIAAWVVPVLFGRAAADQQALMRGIVASALIILLLGSVLFAGIYQVGGIPVADAFADAPLSVGGFFARTSLTAGIIWGPVLALSWFVLAQGVERRKGEDRARRGSI